MFNEIVDKRFEEINNLDGKVNSNDLIYRYKGNTTDDKLDKSDDAFSLLDKIRDGKIVLADVTNDQEEFQ